MCQPYHIEALEGLLRGLPIHVYYMTKFQYGAPVNWSDVLNLAAGSLLSAKYTLGIQVKVLKNHLLFLNQKTIFLMLKRAVSMRQFFWAPKTKVQMDEKLHVYSKFCL